MISIFICFCFMSCALCSNEEIKCIKSQKLVPWQDAGNRPVVREMTTEHMNSRPPRQVQSLNRNWTFCYYPESKLNEAPSSSSFGDSKWPAVAIPHCWHNYEITRQLHPYILNATDQAKSYFGKQSGLGNITYWWDGWGWYRKHFTVTAPIKNKRVFLEFEAVMKYCRVYLNGQYLGEHKGGFTAFSFDVTDHLRKGQPNVLALAVRNKLNDEHRIPPMHSGNQTYSGGIYRDVNILLKDPVHIPFQGSAEHEGGTYITSSVKGDVTVRTWIRNSLPTEQRVLLRTTILDSKGEEISTVESTKNITAGQIRKYKHKIAVKSPKLWSPEHPALYKVVSKVIVDRKVTDRFESPLGFRLFEWNYKKNVAVLNGKEIHIHGTNRTQDYPWLNQAVPDWIMIQDMRDIRFGQGHNFIRPNIQPNDPLLHDLCDQWGLLVNLSSPNIKNINFSEKVQEKTMREAIRRYRNHPSIVLYSIGNETSDGANSDWIYEEDPTRIIHARKVHGKDMGSHVKHDHSNLDMEQLLRITVRGWTHDDVIPNRRPTNGQHAGTEEWQHIMARKKGGSIRGRIDLNGVMWLYNDNGAARVYKDCPLNNINPKGWVDSYRIPKYIYFLWQAHYTEKPMAFIHPHYWQEKYIGQKKDIVVDSNCETVELFVNGRSQRTQKPNAKNFYTVTFPGVAVERGEISVKGVKGGEKIEKTLIMSGKPERLHLSASHKSFDAARDSVVVLTADVLDSKGIQVQGFNKTLRWSVEGPARLIGPKVWKTDIKKNLSDGGAWYITTPVCNLLRGTGQAGPITVRVKADNMKPAEIKLKAVEVKPEPGSVVSEPTLSNSGRRPVPWQSAFTTKDKSKQTNLLMKPYFQDIKLEGGKSREYYAEQLRKIVLKHSPEIEKHPAVLDAIVSNLADICKSNNGIVVADDFNFQGL